MITFNPIIRSILQKISEYPMSITEIIFVYQCALEIGLQAEKNLWEEKEDTPLILNLFGLRHTLMH